MASASCARSDASGTSCTASADGEAAHFAVGRQVARDRVASGRDAFEQGEPERLVLRHGDDGLRAGQQPAHLRSEEGSP